MKNFNLWKHGYVVWKESEERHNSPACGPCLLVMGMYTMFCFAPWTVVVAFLPEIAFITGLCISIRHFRIGLRRGSGLIKTFYVLYFSLFIMGLAAITPFAMTWARF